MILSRSQPTKVGGVIFLTCVVAGTVLIARPAQAWDPDWDLAFPESRQFGAFAPEYAAGVAANNIRNPKQLIEKWNQLPDDLHLWECGTDNLGSPRRCLDMTFRGSGEYVGKAVVVHFDTINRLWHFVMRQVTRTE